MLPMHPCYICNIVTSHVLFGLIVILIMGIVFFLFFFFKMGWGPCWIGFPQGPCWISTSLKLYGKFTQNLIHTLTCSFSWTGRKSPVYNLAPMNAASSFRLPTVALMAINWTLAVNNNKLQSINSILAALVPKGMTTTGNFYLKLCWQKKSITCEANWS